MKTRISTTGWRTPTQALTAYENIEQPLLLPGVGKAVRRERADELLERDVVRAAVGQAATVFVEALGIEIPGQVTATAPVATTVGGDVVYEVAIELTDELPDLRQG
jgi:hypothetical protein